MCVCVCVCEGEGEGKREKKKMSDDSATIPSASKKQQKENKKEVESAAPLSLVRGSQAEVFSPTETDAKFVSNKPVSSSELISVTAEGTAGSTINPDLTGLLDNKDAISILTDSSGSLVIPQSPSPHAGWTDTKLSPDTPSVWRCKISRPRSFWSRG